MLRTALDSDKPDVLLSHAGAASFLLTYSDLFTTQAELDDFTRRARPSSVAFFDRGLGDPLGIASIIDREPGAVPIGALVTTYRSMQRRNVPYPTVYSDRADLAECDQVMADAGIFNHWRMVATLDGTAWLDLPGYKPLNRPAVIQCLPARLTGIPADFSLVLNPGWRP